MIDTDLPTLLVGYNLTNESFPEFDITEPIIRDGLFWTFKRTERRDKYEEGLRRFIKYVFDNATNGVKYIFTDLMVMRPTTLIKIYRHLLSSDTTVYMFDDRAYIYDGKDTVIGVDFYLFEYFGYSPEKLKFKIKTKAGSLITQRDANDLMASFGYLSADRFIPYLYALYRG